MSIKIGRNWEKSPAQVLQQGLQLRQAVHPDAAPDAQHVVFGQKVHIDAGELLQGTGGAVGIAGIHGHPAAGVAQVVARRRGSFRLHQGTDAAGNGRSFVRRGLRQGNK